MPSITIRNLDEGVKSLLRLQAAQHGHSMEREAREILRTALSRKPAGNTNLAAKIHARFQPLGGVNLPETPRESARKEPEFPA